MGNEKNKYNGLVSTQRLTELKAENEKLSLDNGSALEDLRKRQGEIKKVSKTPLDAMIGASYKMARGLDN